MNGTNGMKCLTDTYTRGEIWHVTHLCATLGLTTVSLCEGFATLPDHITSSALPCVPSSHLVCLDVVFICQESSMPFLGLPMQAV